MRRRASLLRAADSSGECFVFTGHSLQPGQDSRCRAYPPAQYHPDAATRQGGKTIAQIIREGLRLYLNRNARDEVREAFEPLDRLVGAFKDDGSGVAENHDQVLGSGEW